MICTLSDLVRIGDKEIDALIILGNQKISVAISGVSGIISLPFGHTGFKIKEKPSVIREIVLHHLKHGGFPTIYLDKLVRI